VKQLTTAVCNRVDGVKITASHTQPTLAMIHRSRTNTDQDTGHGGVSARLG
jgi:hypothetical protein